MDEKEDTILLRILGVPHAQPRPRWIRGKMVSCIDKKTQHWADAVRKKGYETKCQCEEYLHTFKDAPLDIELGFLLPTDKEELLGEYHAQKPDIDNLVKLVLDQLFAKKGKYLFNCGDERVARITAWKKWAKPDRAGVVVVIKRLYPKDLTPCKHFRDSDPMDKIKWLGVARTSQE